MKYEKVYEIFFFTFIMNNVIIKNVSSSFDSSQSLFFLILFVHHDCHFYNRSFKKSLQAPRELLEKWKILDRYFASEKAF